MLARIIKIHNGHHLVEIFFMHDDVRVQHVFTRLIFIP